MLIRLWAFIARQKLVWLQDHDGEVTLSIAQPSPFGGLIAKRWWPFNVKTVQLGDNGIVKNGSYVKSWKWVKP